MQLPQPRAHTPTHVDFDETLARLHDIAASVIDAERVSILLWKDGPEVRPTCQTPDPLHAQPRTLESGEHALPVQIDGLSIGELRIGPPAAPTLNDPRVLKLLALFVGKSIQAAQLQGVLRSRFAQLALVQSAGRSLGDAVALSSENPNRVARILAKSFYRELRSAGFSVRQIIHAAAEIVSEVSASLKRHKRRQLGENCAE